MKKKILGILVMTLLITTVGITVGMIEKQDNYDNPTSSLNNSIELIDQQNSVFDVTGIFFEIGEDAGAQSFIPEHAPLTKVDLVVAIYGNPPITNYTLSIRESLEGEDIVSSTVNSNDFEPPTVEFIFPDTELTVGMTYWLVLTPDEVSLGINDCHFWRAGKDGYENGEMWYKTTSGGWIKSTGGGWSWDWAFKTYWRDYVPDNPTIDGPPEGKAQERYAYTFSTDDPEGHEVEYQIDWGDGITTNWLGSYESGEEVEKEHQWAYEDNYTIRVRARDVYGAESDWSSMEINMPKTKDFTHPFLQFLEQHPNLFPILRLLLM